MPTRTNRFLESLPVAAGRPWLGYAVALGLSAVALAARFALDPHIPPGFPYLTFFPAVILSSFFFGRGPGVFAGILCGLAAWYFFIPPYHSFVLRHGTWVALGLYAGVVAVDIALIHWMQRANIRLRSERQRGQELAARTELLFHELQHRVSNNLQMIGAVLSLQRRAVGDPAAKQALGDAVAKLQTIGRIQRQLYNPDGAHLALDRFLPDLARELINAVEHGFAQSEGTIHVRATRAGDWFDLTVTDDGAGLPDGFDAVHSNSLGLRIARTLADQLGGTFHLSAATPRGAVARLRFPAAPPVLA